MSWQAVTWVLECSQSVLGSRLVLLAIASHANREGKNSWPSLETIAIEARISRRQVIYSIQALEEQGELSVVRGTGRTNVNHYEILPVEEWVQRLHSLFDGKGAIHSRKRVQSTTKKGEQSAPEPFPNRKEEPSEEKPQDKSSIFPMGEPPKSQDEAEVDRLKVGREFKRVGQMKEIPRPISAKTLDERRRFLLKQAEEIKRKFG